MPNVSEKLFRFAVFLVFVICSVILSNNNDWHHGRAGQHNNDKIHKQHYKQQPLRNESFDPIQSVLQILL